MFDVKKENCNTVTEKLLWNIQELLHKEAPLVLQNEAKVEKQEIQIQDVASPKVAHCQFCGESHITMGQFLACAKKNKNKKG